MVSYSWERHLRHTLVTKARPYRKELGGGERHFQSGGALLVHSRLAEGGPPCPAAPSPVPLPPSLIPRPMSPPLPYVPPLALPPRASTPPLIPGPMPRPRGVPLLPSPLRPREAVPFFLPLPLLAICDPCCHFLL